MVKEGPCYHCGIKSTPLWRNGPPNKPVLCNACGSRWRTRGTLDDYVPKHAMYNNIQMYYNNKRMYQNLKKNQNIQTNELPANKQPDQTDSNPPDDANAAGPSEPGFEDVPRRRRSHLDQVVKSPIERLHKQLCDVMKEEPGIFKKSMIEDVLINRVDNKMFAENETALGAMLLNSRPEDLEPSESVSSSNMKMFDASASLGNDGNGDGPALPENGGNHGDQGASSST